MRNDVEVKLKISGIRQVLRSEGAQRLVNSEAARVAARAGDRFQIHPSKHRWVARAFVESKKDVTVTHADRIRLLGSM